MTWKPIDQVPFRPGLLVKVIEQRDGREIVNLFRTERSDDLTYPGSVRVSSIDTPSYKWLTRGSNDYWTWKRSAWRGDSVTDVLVAMPLCPKETL